MQHRLLASRIQPVHRAIGRCASAERGPEENPVRVVDDASGRLPPVGPAREVVQHRHLACWVQLIHHTAAGGATVVSSAVNVPRRIEDHTCVGIVSIRAREAVQHS